MFCPNCGRKNDERATFCGDCGAPIETFNNRQNVADTAAYVQPGVNYPQSAQPAPFYASQVPPGVQQAPPYIQQVQPGIQYTPTYPQQVPLPIPKKKRTGLIIGLVGGAAVVIAAIILIASLSGGSPVLGTWYCEERGIVLTFQNDTVVVSRTVEGKDEGNYTFSEVKGRGEINADDDQFEFTLDGKQLVVEDIGEFRKAGSSFDADEFLDVYKN